MPGEKLTHHERVRLALEHQETHIDEAVIQRLGSRCLRGRSCARVEPR